MVDQEHRVHLKMAFPESRKGIQAMDPGQVGGVPSDELGMGGQEENTLAGDGRRFTAPIAHYGVTHLVASFAENRGERKNATSPT